MEPEGIKIDQAGWWLAGLVLALSPIVVPLVKEWLKKKSGIEQEKARSQKYKQESLSNKLKLEELLKKVAKLEDELEKSKNRSNRLGKLLNKIKIAYGKVLTAFQMILIDYAKNNPESGEMINQVRAIMQEAAREQQDNQDYEI